MATPLSFQVSRAQPPPFFYNKNADNGNITVSRFLSKCLWAKETKQHVYGIRIPC